MKIDKAPEKKKKDKIDYKQSNDDENLAKINNEKIELENKVKEFEEANKLIRETTGADDINEICQKYSNLRETKDKLKRERKDLERLCEILTKRKDDLANELNILKYEGQDDATRKEIEENEKTVDRTIKACEESKTKLKKAEKLTNDVRAGIGTITNLLQTKIYEEVFNDDKNFTEKENSSKQAYKDMTSIGDSDLRLLLTKTIEVSEYIFQRYKFFKENFPTDESENKLNRKEENDLEQIYLQQSMESLDNSLSANEDDGLDNKEYGFNNNNAIRSNTADPRIKKNRISLRAKDKKIKK